MNNITIVNGYIVAGGTKKAFIVNVLTGEEVEQMELMEKWACSVHEEEVMFKVDEDGFYEVALFDASYENVMDLIEYFVKIHNKKANWYVADGYYYLCLFNDWVEPEAQYDDLEYMMEVQCELDSHNNPPIEDDEEDYETYRNAGLNFWQIKERDARVGLIRFIDDFGNEVIIEGDLPF